MLAYSTRAMSSLAVQKCAMRVLGAADRLLYALRTLVRDFGRVANGEATLAMSLPSRDLCKLIGAGEDRVRHLLSDLREHVWRRDGRLVVRTTPVLERGFPKASTYLGRRAEWARPDLGDLLRRCTHFELSERSIEYIRRNASLFEVPDGALLLPPDACDGLAFVVSGAASLEAAGRSGEPLVLQLVPPGRLVRLPTRRASSPLRMQGRAHGDSVVALLSAQQTLEAFRLLSIEGQRGLLDVTTRGFSRFLCDCTTASTRNASCRLLSALGFLAQDFGRTVPTGFAIEHPLGRADLACLIDAGAPAAGRARDRLIADGWLENPTPGRYVLRKPPPGSGASPGACPYCTSIAACSGRGAA